MRINKFYILLIVTFSLLSAAISANALELGDLIPAADVNMKNVDGKELSFNDIKGEYGTLVIFSCNHCPYVIAWEDRITSIGNSYLEKGFGVIAVNSNNEKSYPGDGFEGMVERAAKLGLKFPYVVDATSDVARVFGAMRTPEIFLFDKRGKLIYQGAIDDNAEDADKVSAHYLKEALDAVLIGNDISLKETKSLGCSIKFRDKKVGS